jgi:large conductance mechanosensitive channel
MAEAPEKPEVLQHVGYSPIHAPRFITGFFDFITQYGVIPLAIGVVIGSAVNDLVKTIVDGITTPLISLLTPSKHLETWQVTFHGAVFKFGAVINSLISFFTIAIIVYLVVKVVIRKDEYLKK